MSDTSQQLVDEASRILSNPTERRITVAKIGMIGSQLVQHPPTFWDYVWQFRAYLRNEQVQGRLRVHVTTYVMLTKDQNKRMPAHSNFVIDDNNIEWEIIRSVPSPTNHHYDLLLLMTVKSAREIGTEYVDSPIYLYPKD